MSVLHILENSDWEVKANAQAVSTLEQSKVLFLSNLSFDLSASEKKLISPDYIDSNFKNMSFDNSRHHLKGLKKLFSAEEGSFKKLLCRYAQTSKLFIESLMPIYSTHLEMGRTSLRLIEISGRKAPSYRKDDTRLHIDAFPANPNQGRRILRMFTNINPDGKPRCWRIGQDFEETAKHFLPHLSPQFSGKEFLMNLFRITKSSRTQYDHIMLNIHDRMKKDLKYQQNINFTALDFPARTSWITFTDSVSHAALSGQHLLEQTFYLPVSAMEDETKSPLRILERLMKRKLI